MKKKISKILFVIIVVMILFMVVSLNISFAAETFYEGYYLYTIENDEVTITKVYAEISGDITIPSKLGGYSVTCIGDGAFYECESLECVIIPDSVVCIEEAAFYGCNSLENVTISDSVVSIGEAAFYGCNSLENITIPDSVATIGAGAFYMCENLKSITIPDSVVCIDEQLFRGCTKLCSVTIGKSVATIGEGAFGECLALDSIIIPNSVTSIGNYAFWDCASLENITISNSVKIIGNAAFSGCTNLESIIIPDTVTSIGDGAFYECCSLENITIPDSVTSIGESAFYCCSNLESITIGTSVTSIGEGAFYRCLSLEGITIPDSVIRVGDFAFSGCISLESVTISNSVISIGKSSFSACTKLESIIIGSSVKYIGEGAFYYCTTLESIIISDAVTNIDKNAFDGCSNIKNVYYTGTKSQWKNIDIDPYNDPLTDATIHYNYCEHKYTNTCDKTCNLCGATRTIKHKYTNSCDKTCNVCSATRTITHTYKTTTTKATLSATGRVKTVCAVCGVVKTNKVVNSPKTFTLSATSYTYNGYIKTPSLTVKDSAGNVLKKDTDYTVTYAEGRKNAGTYKVIVKMKGNYTGTKTLSFNIKPIDISKCTAKLSATSVTYNGKVRTPTVIITNPSGVKLTKDTHYTVTYSSGRKNVGTYNVTVKMFGNYTGTKTLSFKINPINISTCKVKLSATSLTYNGNVRTPVVTVTNSYGTKLTKDKHCTVTYATGRKNVGTYNVKVTMKGNYTGTKTLSFKINPIDISKCTVKLSATSLTYNGNVRTSTVTVTNSYGTKLTKDTHYTVSYATGRKNVGTYKVTVKMKGNYTGTKTLTFKILPQKTTISKLTAGTKKITVNLTKKTTQVTGYQIQYATNKNFTNAKTKTLTSNSTVKTTLSSLTANKTYYVRVRTYKTVNDVKYYSGWSAYKYVKTK